MGICASGDVGVGVEGRNLDDIEVGGGGAVEEMEVAVVPVIVGRAADIHRGAVVGEDQAIFLHGVEDDLIRGGITGSVEAGFEAQARAHGRRVGVGAGGGPVRGGRSEAGAGVRKSETDGVIDGARSNFIVANQSRKNRQTGGIGTGPGVGALLVGEQIPDGAGVRVPSGGLWEGAVELVEEAVGFIEDEDVAIAGAGIGIAFDRSAEGNGHGAGIGFAAVGLVIDRDESLRGVDYAVGNADVRAVVFALAEVGMDADGRTDEIDDAGGVGIDGRG